MNKYVWRGLIVNNKELVYEETRSKSVSFRYLYFVFKRIFDVFVGFIGILFLIPLALFVKIITICSGDFHSIFFKQKNDLPVVRWFFTTPLMLLVIAYFLFFTIKSATLI